MTVRDRYATPTAFRRALTDRLREAAARGPRRLQQLQRQITCDGSRGELTVNGAQAPPRRGLRHVG